MSRNLFLRVRPRRGDGLAVQTVVPASSGRPGLAIAQVFELGAGGDVLRSEASVDLLPRGRVVPCGRTRPLPGRGIGNGLAASPPPGDVPARRLANALAARFATWIEAARRGDVPRCELPGLPMRISVDNVREWHGASFVTAAAAAGVDVLYRPVRRPRGN